ncbi:DNA internalization-related competence protein ComEC/Rec2 [Oscillibacter valericigenes]|uniref:DNA internalization-related competence protein ComEC/Rec2 n=1 Tax=Oscillibacter valericigenes TaxID=351091 RepID=UPI001F48CE44|nr:DNA internalization-related competence protein ComEC/Rec2 [Oscillibacter valericigenes]MCF2616906.1 DNA internalization-related competence protein ComEC/Rec2 [Oscillibacter valericigenes]
MRILATFTGAFALGIFLAQYLLPVEWLLPCGAAAFVLAFGRLFLRNDTGRRVLLVGVGLALAFGYDWLYIRQVQRPMEELAGTQREMTMTLCDYAISTGYGAKVTVRLEDFPGKAVYYGEEKLLELEPGQTVTDLVQLQSAARIRDDDVTSFTSKGVFLLAYRRGEASYGEGTSASPRWWPVRMGRAMQSRIAELFMGDEAGFLTAILTGDKSRLSDEGAAALSEAGLYHILAVSGMHCGFLLALVTYLTGKHRRRLTALCALPLLAFYAALTGGSPSVLRSCVMLAFLLAAPVCRRDSDGPTALLAALFLILLANPFAAASISLQLSFTAMAGILFLTPRLYRLLMHGRKGNRVTRFLAAGFSATMGALVFTVPLSGWYFGTLTLISPLSNLLCLWAASGVFVLELVTVLLGFFCLPPAKLLAVVPALLTRYILLMAGLLAKIPYHAAYFANPYLKYWLAYAYILFLTAWLRRKAPRRKYALAAILTCLTLALTVKLGEWRYHAGLDVKVLDVGQGQCVLLASGGDFTLVDCGSGNSWYGPGEIASQHLRAMGCRKLDRLVLTHYDSDHISGVRSLLARMDVDTLLVPELADDGLGGEILELAREHGVTVETVESRTELPMGKAVLTVLPPVGEGEDNERGLSVLASAEDADILITGDMDAATERKFLEAYDLPDIEVLVAGHHGSKYSTSNDLLDALTPETACISVGSNSYGHPADETMRRLAEHGCAIYRTDMQGTIHLSLN